MEMKNNYLLVQEIEQQERTTTSGIIMPNEKYKGTMVRLDNVEHELIHITDLIAILTEDNG
jgi:co-chaperonin GroES (HSP10)